MAEQEAEFYSYTRTQFDAAYEDYVRTVTNPNGRGNAAYSQEHEKAMPPQDKLVAADITLGKTTGIACEFTWLSGRKDAWIVADLPVESVAPEVVAERKQYIELLKERNNHVVH